MKGNFKADHALTVLTSTRIETGQKGDVENWQKLVAQQFDEIARAERLTPRRAVALGLMLHLVKASLAQGQFEAWKKQMLTKLTFASEGTARVYASYYMRLAIVFAEESKLGKPELAALPAGGLALNLESAQGAAAKLVKKIDGFCGEDSITELLVKHDIKKVGAGGGSAVAPVTVGNDQAADDAMQWLLNLRQTYLDPDKVKTYPAKHLKGIEQQAASFLTEYRKVLAALNVG